MARTSPRTIPNIDQRPGRGADLECSRSPVVLGENARSHRRGFTIVELLIVIVVIAILAAVTIVAYNGISKRAKASAAQSAAQQVAKKIATYTVTNGEGYPADLATIGVTDDGSTNYQYSVNNGASSRSYCVTVTVTDISYFISSTQQSPKEGGCPGHGQGGVASITNLAVNPSFEAGSSTIEVRRNLTRYPNAETGTTAGWNTSAGSTISSSADLAHSGTRSYRVVTPGVATSEGISQAGSAATGPESSGVAAAETLSAWVHAPAGATLIFAAEEYVPDGAFVATRGTANFTGTGGWQRVSVGGAKATSTNILRSYVRTRMTAQAITFYVDDSLNENVPTLNDYFDGSISPDTDLAAAWTGAANQSESVLSAQKPSGFTSGSATNLMYFQSSSWKSSGANSVRLRSAYTAADPGSFISVNNLNAQLVTGRTYTAVAKVRLEAPLSGALRSERLRLQIRTTGGAIAADSNTPPNEAGEYEVRVTWTHNGNSSLRLYHGGVQGSGDVWFDDLMIVEGTYTGPARNGDSRNWVWNGTPHASTSTGPNQ